MIDVDSKRKRRLYKDSGNNSPWAAPACDVGLVRPSGFQEQSRAEPKLQITAWPWDIILPEAHGPVPGVKRKAPNVTSSNIPGKLSRISRTFAHMEN